MAAQKNVLFILSDEFRPDCLCGPWAGLVQTPHLDALMREGVCFEHCYCQASPCAPSRMSIHTGRYMCSTGTVDNMTPLADPEENLGMWLRSHGLDPCIAGYNDYALDPRRLDENHPHRASLCYDHFLPGYRVVLDHEHDSPEWFAYLRDQGYPEELCDRTGMRSTVVPKEGLGGHLPCHYPAPYKAEDSESNFLTGKTIEFMEENRGKGWFINVNFIKPHPPYLSPAPYNAMYSPESVPEPVRDASELGGQDPYFSRMKPDSRKGDFQDELIWREMRACYLGMVTEIDACVGRLIDGLKENGEWDNTLIVFGADHGTYLGDHYLSGKVHFYEQAMHVPLIVRDPRPEADGTRGSRRLDLVENVDIAPTICEFLDVPGMPRAQGKSLLPLLSGKQGATGRDAVFFEFYYYGLLAEPGDAVPAECRLWVHRDERYKYVVFGEKAMPSLLFDLQEDANEFNNLAGSAEYAEVCRRAGEDLIRWRIRCEDLRMEDWARQYR
jgi:arylsulfatase A-like enzyme